MIGWLIYGNVIYFSGSNNCASFDATKGLNTMMLFFLIVGYFQFIAFGCIVFVLPCLLFWLDRRQA